MALTSFLPWASDLTLGLRKGKTVIDMKVGQEARHT